MPLVLLLGFAFTFFFLHKQKKLHGYVVFPLALVASAIAWWFVAKTAALPQRMTRTGEIGTGENELPASAIVASSSHLWLANDDSLRHFDLSTMRVVSKLPLSTRIHVLTSVAAHGTSLLLTWHDGENGSWALIDRDAWVVAPTQVFDADAAASAYWDSSRNGYVIASRPKQKNVRHFTIVDEAGKTKETITFDDDLPLPMISVRSFCPVRDEVIGNAGYATCKAKLEAGAKWTCTDDMHPPRCPESVDTILTGSAAVIARDGRVDERKLPKNLEERFAAPVSVAYTEVGPDGVTPRYTQSTFPKGGPFVSLVPVGDAFITARQLSDAEAKAIGHQPESELELESFDLNGVQTGHAFLLDSAASWRTWIGAAGGDLVIVSGDMQRVARFDLHTLARRDPISTVDSVRERLARWGGPSWTFEAGLVMTLSLAGLVPFFGLLWILGRTSTPGGARAIWATRVMAVLVTFAVPTLLALVSRFYQR